ncbi:hypothetical protein ACRS8P_11545 [Burkholderia cenocepacia]
MTIRLGKMISRKVGGRPRGGGARCPPGATAGERNGTGDDTSICFIRQTQYSDMQRCKTFMKPAPWRRLLSSDSSTDISRTKYIRDYISHTK